MLEHSALCPYRTYQRPICFSPNFLRTRRGVSRCPSTASRANPNPAARSLDDATDGEQRTPEASNEMLTPLTIQETKAPNNVGIIHRVDT